MPRKALPLKRHFIIQQDNHSIVMQLILFELIQAFEIVKEIGELYAKVSSRSYKKISKKNRDSLDLMMKAFTRLAGGTPNTIQFLLWNSNSGVLSRIKDNCSFLCHDLNFQESDPQILRHADDTWMQSLECIEEIQEVLDLSPDGAFKIPLLNKAMEKMSSKLYRLAKKISELLKGFTKDENVLYFLLCNRVLLDNIYRKRFVLAFFHDAFPKGLTEAGSFLTERYAARGFPHVAEQIEEKIAELEGAAV